MKRNNYLCLTAFLAITTIYNQALAEEQRKFYLKGEQYTSDIKKAIEAKNVRKGDIMEIQEHVAGVVCDFDKAIIRIEKQVICSYLGYVRNDVW